MKSILAQLVEQIVKDEIEELEEQNALAAGGVSATSTGGALTAAQKKHKDKTGNGTRHDLLWAGDEVTSDKKSVVQERYAEVPQGSNSDEQALITALSRAKYAGKSETTLDDLVASNKELRSLNRSDLRKTLDNLSRQGMIDYTFSLECDGKTLFSGTFSDYSKLSGMKLALLKRKCKSGSKMAIADKIGFSGLIDEEFKSQAQRGYFYAQAAKGGKTGAKFKDMAKEFEADTPKGKKLPKYVKS